MKTAVKEKIQLDLEKRTIVGKKVKKLRKEGKIPGNVYGEDFASQSVMVAFKDFTRIFKKSGETQIVHAKLETLELPVLIQNVQRNPLTDTVLHVDFRKVNLKKKIQTEVPVHFVGQSEAVTQSKGVLLTMTETLKVEALPEAIPQSVDIDISILKELNQEIKVKDLKPTGEYIFVDDPEKTIIRITEHKEESTETQVVAPETVEVTTEKKEEVASEEAAEGQPAKEEKKVEKKEEKK